MANDPQSSEKKQSDPKRLIVAVDLAGTFLFGAEGALTAIANELDVFGVLALSFVTALGGGVVRDILIGAVPPAALRDWRYPASAFIAGGVTFILHSLAGHIMGPVVIVL